MSSGQYVHEHIHQVVHNASRSPRELGRLLRRMRRWDGHGLQLVDQASAEGLQSHFVQEQRRSTGTLSLVNSFCATDSAARSDTAKSLSENLSLTVSALVSKFRACTKKTDASS
jgi:hypothetical protein